MTFIKVTKYNNNHLYGCVRCGVVIFERYPSEPGSGKEDKLDKHRKKCENESNADSIH